MLVPAKYDDNGTMRECLLSTDFVVDIFKEKQGFKDVWIAYTFDNERGGYYIDNDTIQKILEEQE